MSSSDEIKALEREANKIGAKHDCVFCKYILVVSVLLFVTALLLFLFVQFGQRYSPKKQIETIPVEQIQPEARLTPDEEMKVLNNLRAQVKAESGTRPTITRTLTPEEASSVTSTSSR